MEKLEICKKLMRLRWMSQAAIDNKVCGYANTRMGILRGLSLRTKVHDIVMSKIRWGETHGSRYWPDVYKDYERLGACIRDIA